MTIAVAVYVASGARIDRVRVRPERRDTAEEVLILGTSRTAQITGCAAKRRAWWAGIV
jgi:hypothetical protein